MDIQSNQGESNASASPSLSLRQRNLRERRGSWMLYRRSPVAIEQAPEYVSFRANYAKQRISLDNMEWIFYEHGRSTSESTPLLCIPGTSSTAELYFRQILAFASQGQHILSVQYPPATSVREWAVNLKEFIDHRELQTIHLYGTGMGAYLACWFAAVFPSRVESLILTNGFNNTSSFYRMPECRAILSWTPKFMLQNYVLSNFQTGIMEIRIADAADFVVAQFDSLTRKEILGRLYLNISKSRLPPLNIDADRITFIDPLDDSSMDSKLREDLRAQFPGAHLALIKTGGDFPCLSRYEQVNLHIQVHLNRHCLKSSEHNSDI